MTRDFNVPLAARVRPESLDDFIGQSNLVGVGKALRNLIESDQLVSMIFWGPPGSGKTTLARIIAKETSSRFIQISAVESGKDELRKIVKMSRESSNSQKGFFESEKGDNPTKTILFIDEIHRFNKAQQDFLLPFVEDGTIILIGATTENPSFEVISPLLSRCRVFILERHVEADIVKILKKALADKKNWPDNIEISVGEDVLEYIADYSNGDGRSALNILEIAVKLAQNKKKDDKK